MALWDRVLPWRRRSAAQALEVLTLDDRREVAAAGVLGRRRENLELAAQYGLDADDWMYRKLTSGARLQHRDLSPLQQDRMLQVTWYLWEQNPFAKRLVTLMTDLIVGEGVTVAAEDERIQDQIDKTWNHRINQFATRIREMHNFASLTGELILPVTQNTVSGRPVYGFIDPYQVKEVIPVPGNILIPDLLILKDSAAQAGERLKIVRENPETGRLEGEVFFWAINKLPNSLRGRSDLLPLADWLDLYDQYLFAEVERLQLLSAFVWDLTVKGATETDITKKLQKFPTPKPGSVYGHNENEELEARTPDLKAADRSEVASMLRRHIGGSMGFPTSYLGDVDSNRATIEGQNDVMMKTPAARQKEFRAFIDLMVRFAVEGVTTKNPALFRDAKTGYTVNMPEIAAKDVSRVGGVIAQVVTAMDTAMANNTMSRRLATTVVVSLLGQLGIQADANTILEEVEKEREERQAVADEIQSQMAKRRSPNPPIPGDEDQDEDEDREPAQAGAAR